MNRENKFRAFDKFNEDMFYSGERLSEFFRDVERRIKGGNRIEVMEYTGLKDKNGVEIYEGDVLDCHGLHEVKYLHSSFKGVPLDQDFDIPQCFGEWQERGQIIGNIYENPELLENL